MNVEELRGFLKILAAYDGRTIGEADVVIWSRQLADVEAIDATEAVHTWYGETRDWAYPADIKQRAERHHNRRNRRPEVVAPGCYEPDPAERRRLVASEDGLMALPAPDDRPLTDRSAELQEFVGGVRGTLPAGDPDTLRYGTRQWRQDQTAWQRQQNAQPNPHYDPNLRPVDDVADIVPATTRGGEAWWTDDRARERHARELLAQAGRLTPITDAAPSAAANV